MTSLCQRTISLDLGPLLAIPRDVSRGLKPETADAEVTLLELQALTADWFAAVAKVKAGTLTRTEALAMLADEPCPATERGH